MWEAGQSPDGRGERLRDWLKPPRSLEEMEREFERNAADPASDIIDFIIQADDRIIGDIDFFRIDERNRCALVGIGIWRAEDRGKGYGYDALVTACRWAFQQLNLHRIELSCDPDNAPAFHIYEKCGFVLEGRQRKRHFQDGDYHDELIMGLLREDFDAQHAS
jgi:RimJ/RimL family protein N-acetyltransferase